MFSELFHVIGTAGLSRIRSYFEYSQAARIKQLPKWSFVRLAKLLT
jgi:hypothetical protein